MGWSLQHPSRGGRIESPLDGSVVDLGGIAKVVTGCGKTYFACICMTGAHEKEPKSRIAIIVPTDGHSGTNGPLSPIR